MHSLIYAQLSTLAWAACGEENVLHDEARIERDSFFESSSYLNKRFFKQSRSLLSQTFT